VEFGILGAVELTVDGRAVTPGGPKQRALLAFLLVNANEVVSRDRLVEGLWGEHPPLTAQRSLDSYVSRLRGLLGPERIERKAPGYKIVVGTGELDLQRFEEMLESGRKVAAAGDAPKAATMLRAALALWRGPALADVLDAPFADRTAQWLDERRLVALEARIACDLVVGGDDDLVSELEPLVAQHPFREQLVESLMLALYRGGRQADALAAYQTVRRRLSEELGLEPGPQLRALEREILEQAPRLAATPGSPPRSSARSIPARRHVIACAAVAAAAAVAIGIKIGTQSSPASIAEATSARVVELGGHSSVEKASTALTAAAAAMAADGNSLWVAEPDAGAIVRVNPAASRVVERITLGGNPGAIAVGGGAVWVADIPGETVSRIDPLTETRTQTISLGGARATGLAFGLGKLWVADSVDRALLVFDPQSGGLRRTLDLDAHPTTVALGAGLVWVADYDAGSVTGVDARSGHTVTTARVGNGPTAIAFGGGAVWVANSLDSTVSRIDPTTGSVAAVIPVGSDPVALLADATSVWAASRYAGTVSRIDQRRNVVADISDAGGGPTALAATGGKIWVATSPQARHRGGTLILLHTAPISIDPALQLDLFPLQSDGLTRDGLVTYNHTSGPEGLRLVPDLALGLPVPGAGGTTYTFHLRPGIRYSNGARLHADDFRRALERLFILRSGGAEYFGGIVGARACRAGHCDLSAGIVADDSASTVTFRLTAPDPTFLQKLTIGGLSTPVPAGTPVTAVRTRPIPGTGPYRIAAAGRSEIRYVRNPYFKEWSHAAQPDGNPDVIVMRFGLGPEQEVRAVESGRADWTADAIPARMVLELQTRYPGQRHISPGTETDFLQINTATPPFDDARVRRALNYAVDRRQVAALYGGDDAASPTCQVLPPGITGYRRYCPYTRHATGRGAWVAPDLVTARRLIRASGTRGQQITVWAASDAAGPVRAIVSYTVGLLNRLGYRARSHLEPSSYFQRASPSQFRRMQIAPPGWADDTPYNFFATWLTCAAAYNHRWFCDPAVDRAVRRAQARQSTNPRSASDLWAALDRKLVDRAAWVPLVNPRQVDLVSKRVRNYQHHAIHGVIADQLEPS
jgi:YVTN family beta-propeller protein